ncbi:MAG: mechanosensitive ion channel family protein [Chloroflexi bacterium]|nr:mechanosensitive ion channel family protein [Chloroflexota bacterium]
MLEQLFGESPLRQILLYSLFFGVFVGLARLFHFFLRKVAKRLAHKARTHLDDALVSTIEKPVMAVIILVGVYLAILSFPMEAVIRRYASQWLGIVLGLLGIYIALILFEVVIRWYTQEVMSKRKEVGLTARFLTLFRVTMLMAAVLLAVLVVLGGLGISSAPVTSWLREHGWRIAFIAVLSVIAIIVVGELTPRWIVRTLSRRAGETEEESIKRGDTLSRVLVGTAQIVVLVMAIFMVLSELEINIAPILAGVGVAGIAIGFGAQSLVKDVVNGLFIVFENQYRVGDWVRIADVDGLVEDVNLRRTVLRDFNGAVHTVPNGEIRVATDYTKDWSRVNMNVSVAYGEDLDHVILVINRVGKELSEDPEWAPSILTPPQALGVDKLGDSGIEIKILGETKPMRPWAIMRELRLRLKKAFDKEGIEIPWPHTKVYFGNSPSAKDD